MSDGIPHSSLVSASESDRVDVGRYFPRDPSSRAQTSKSAMTMPKSLCCRRTTIRALSVLQCGEMLSAVLLDATMVGLATCTLTHITELWPGREIVAALIGRRTTSHPRSLFASVGAVDRRRTAADATTTGRRGIRGSTRRGSRTER